MKQDLAIGIAVTGARSALTVGHYALLPARVALRAPVIGPPLRRRTYVLEDRGRRTRERARELTNEDLDRAIVAVLDHARTEQIVETVLQSPGLERLVVRVLESRFVDDLTERVLHSPELERVVEYVATSPLVLDAVSHQTRTLADEMATNVRRRAESVDDVAEHAVRGWLRRPRPQPT